MRQTFLEDGSSATVYQPFSGEAEPNFDDGPGDNDFIVLMGRRLVSDPNFDNRDYVWGSEQIEDKIKEVFTLDPEDVPDSYDTVNGVTYILIDGVYVPYGVLVGYSEEVCKEIIALEGESMFCPIDSKANLGDKVGLVSALVMSLVLVYRHFRLKKLQASQERSGNNSEAKANPVSRSQSIPIVHTYKKDMLYLEDIIPNWTRLDGGGVRRIPNEHIDQLIMFLDNNLSGGWSADRTETRVWLLNEIEKENDPKEKRRRGRIEERRRGLTKKQVGEIQNMIDRATSPIRGELVRLSKEVTQVRGSVGHKIGELTARIERLEGLTAVEAELVKKLLGLLNEKQGR